MRSGDEGTEEGPKVINLSYLDGHNWPRLKVSAMGTRRYLCEKCGTWACARCGHERKYANRKYTGVMSCAKCGCVTGRWKVVYHHLQKWANHYGHVPLRDWVYEDWQRGLPGRTGK